MSESDPSFRARSDAILVALPVAFLVTYGLGQVAVESRLAVAIASLVCGAILVDGLFLNPPVGDA